MFVCCGYLLQDVGGDKLMRTRKNVASKGVVSIRMKKWEKVVNSGDTAEMEKFPVLMYCGEGAAI